MANYVFIKKKYLLDVRICTVWYGTVPYGANLRVIFDWKIVPYVRYRTGIHYAIQYCCIGNALTHKVPNLYVLLRLTSDQKVIQKIILQKVIFSIDILHYYYFYFAISIITLFVLDASILCEAKTGGLMLPACWFVLSLRNKFD